jgi:hypothetical protein
MATSPSFLAVAGQCVLTRLFSALGWDYLRLLFLFLFLFENKDQEIKPIDFSAHRLALAQSKFSYKLSGTFIFMRRTCVSLPVDIFNCVLTF